MKEGTIVYVSHEPKKLGIVTKIIKDKWPFQVKIMFKDGKTEQHPKHLVKKY